MNADMNGVIELKEEQVYFYAGFYDSELTIPTIETWVYVGRDEDKSFLFQDAASHVARHEGTEHVEGSLFSFPEDEIGGVLDKAHLIQWLSEEHSPTQVGRSYKYVETE